MPTKKCGDGHRRISGTNWTKWISPVIGSKPVRKLTRDDVENVRDALDRALGAQTIRHSTARNIWGTLTVALKAARKGKDRSLRVLETSIHIDVEPPDAGDSRQRPWLYPNEWVRLATCEDVPIAWRQTYAVAVYTGLRPNELRVLTWADVDLDASKISVSKSYDIETGVAKAPKTRAGQREVKFPETLMPVLEATRRKPTDLVLPTLSMDEDRFAPMFREYLRIAGINRPRLTANNGTEEPIDFRSLRDSYATWLALAGIDHGVIQRRLGHASPTTTERYIKAAESLDPKGIGAPFPALPSALCTNVWTNVWTRKNKTPGFPRGFSVARGRYAGWTT